ncbi:TusE/DsrC/DsvC family sulfur relay protein [Thiohalophilus sp.]|uniref:TusE/DsrC/DsvC family sulfur relay protein n=1 Tax=Thiohalophilus sp. TaxID=3028392 RepID=UPI003975C4DA
MTAAINNPVMPELDEDGLLVNPQEWTEEVARLMAQQLNVPRLTDDHWLVIYSLRDYFQKFGAAPAMNSVCHRLDKDKFWIHELFHSCLNAWRISGLPNPGEEAKSYLNDM